MPERVVLAIDPGDVHMGTCLGIGTEVSWAKEMGPGELFWYLEEQLPENSIDVVVCESWQLYEDKAYEQVGSELLVVQHIGIIRYICTWHGIRCVMQPAMIKKPTAKICKAKRIKSKGGGNQHAKDAELHFWKFTLDERNAE